MRIQHLTIKDSIPANPFAEFWPLQACNNLYFLHLGIMTTPCSSPLTIQDEAVSKINGLNGMNGLNGLNGLNGINGMNGVTNGHVDHHHSVYNGRTGRPRRDIGSIHSQPPGTGSYPRYDTMYGYPSDPTGYYR